MTTKNKVLAGLMGLQAVLLIVVFWPASSGSGIEKMFPGLKEVDVIGVTITDSEGRSIRLARSALGCVLPDADDYPCLKDKFPDFLGLVVPITTASLVAETKGSHSRLKVADDDFERVIDVETVGGNRYKLYLGTSPRGRSAHVRADGRDQVYVAASLSAFDASAEAAAWVDPVYFSVPQDRVLAFTLENGSGGLRLEKEESGDWTLVGDGIQGTLDQTKAQSLARRASSLRLLRPLGKEELDSYGLKEPIAVLTISTKNDDSGSGDFVLQIGAEYDQEKGFVVKSSKSDYYVVMGESSVQDFIDKGSDDLLESPSTAIPESTQ
jgi:hypothetical protein